MLGGIAFAIRGIVCPWIGVWLADILLFTTGIVMFYRIAKK